MAFLSLEAVEKSSRYILPSIVFGVSLIAYSLTLCPTVHVGDSGEFITNAFILGINHPTGYPLHSLLGRTAVLLLPFLTPAVAVNFLSALAASLSAVFAFAIVKIVSTRVDVATTTALLFGFSTTLWSRATTAEVYPLVLLSEAIAIYFLLRWTSGNDARDLIALAYVTGLGLSQHVLGLLIAACIFLYILIKRPAIFLNLRLLLILLGFAFLGWTTYLYLPIRASAHPPIAWGNPETLRNFIHHLYPVAGKGISYLFAGEQGGRFTRILEQTFTKEFWYFGILAIPGLYRLRHRQLLLFLFVSIPVLVVFFTVNRNMPFHADFDAYLLPVHLIVAILIGCGILLLYEIIEGTDVPRKLPGYRIAFSGFVFLLPLALLLINFSGEDKSRDYFGQDFGTNLMRTVGRNSIVFTIGDEQTFLAWYKKYVEKTMSDATIIDAQLLGASWGGTHMFQGQLELQPQGSESAEAIARQIIHNNIGKRPICFTNRLPWDFLETEYAISYTGMLIQILPKGTDISYQPTNFTFHPPTLSASLDERCNLLSDFYPKQLAVNAQFWINRGDVAAARSELKQFFALPLLRKSNDIATALILCGIISAREHSFSEAVGFADSALRVNSGDWRIYEYRGEFLLEKGDTLQALRDWHQSLELNPQNPHLRQMTAILSRALRNF